MAHERNPLYNRHWRRSGNSTAAGHKAAFGKVIVVQSDIKPIAQTENPPRSSWPLVDHLARLANDLGIDPKEFPIDLATHHDHYAHGAPKGIDEQ